MSTNPQYTYPQNVNEATLRLSSLIKEKIRNEGPISFSTYMHLSLYHPDHGYYTRGSENVGKSGDFFTSVSVGSCFGIILAHRIYTEWIQQEKPPVFHLIELGANTAQLAKDILDTLQSSFPDLYNICKYHIIEHIESVKTTQKETLSIHIDRLSHHSELIHIGENGFILSNELIDAFPVKLLKFSDQQWHENMVTLNENDEFKFTLKELNKEIQSEIQPIFKTLPNPPEHYQTEYRPNIQVLASNLKKALTKALILTIDYGHTLSGFYAASRSTGTLRCYYKHQADEEPLQLPGVKDITAHVDFTQLGHILKEAGFRLTDFSSQSHYLTSHGADWLKNMELSGELDFKLIRQFQTLTHPTTMGHQFHFLEAHTHQVEDSDTIDKLELR